MSKINVKFLIDKEQNRVVLAEAGSDFVDVLFSFLTLPLGSIVRLLSKQTFLGSLDNLYESVDQLDTKHLQTEACKEMLVNPRSAATLLCEDLKIKNIHDPFPRDFYCCSENNCLVHSACYYTYINSSLCCRCGKQMNDDWLWRKDKSVEGGVFVNEATDFLITHDLKVLPASLLNGCSILKEAQIKDTSILEERTVDFGTEEVLNLLQRSLVSQNALTEAIFPDACLQENADCSLPIKEEMVVNEGEHEIILKLLLNKKNNKVLHAEVGEDFINNLLSFLTLPLGSVLRFLPDNIALGFCFSNLYKSVEIIGLNHFKSEICRNMLLAPKLPTFYGFKNQILEMEEITSRTELLKGCRKCFLDNGFEDCTSAPCIHGIEQSELIEQNPKSTKEVTGSGEAFLANSKRFMVSDNLSISPLSFISAIDQGTILPISDLVNIEVCMDKGKARSLLGAMLISNTVLSDVFFPKQPPEEKEILNKCQNKWKYYRA